MHLRVRTDTHEVMLYKSRGTSRHHTLFHLSEDVHESTTTEPTKVFPCPCLEKVAYSIESRTTTSLVLPLSMRLRRPTQGVTYDMTLILNNKQGGVGDQSFAWGSFQPKGPTWVHPWKSPTTES